MQYIVKSRGEAIGTTDLGFARAVPNARMGWFQPNDAGERVMPVIASTLPAVRAFLRSDGRAGCDRIPGAVLATSTEYADLTEAMHHVGALDLTLHREDGTLIPTEHVGIQDTEQLLELARIDDAMLGIDDPDMEAAHEDIEELLRERFGLFGEEEQGFDPAADDPLDEREPWKGSGPANPRERYMIIVLHPEGTDVP